MRHVSIILHLDSRLGPETIIDAECRAAEAEARRLAEEARQKAEADAKAKREAEAAARKAAEAEARRLAEKLVHGHSRI